MTGPEHPRVVRLRHHREGREGSIGVEDHGEVLIARITGSPHAELLPGVVDDLSDLLDLVEDAPQVRAVVLTGTHPERFVAHTSVRWLQEGSAGSTGPRVREAEDSRLRGVARLLTFHDTLLRMHSSGAVFVAALNGSALGGGCELALACDLRVMADGPFMFGLPEVLMGLTPGGGGTQRLPRLIGVHRALKHILLGAPMTPAEALACGAVDGVVAPEDLLETAAALALRYGSRGRGAVGAVKRSVHLGTGMELEDGLALERSEFLAALSTATAQERMSAHEASVRSHGELPLYRPEVYRTALQVGGLPTGDY